MTNEYYTSQPDVAPATKARSVDLNALDNGIEAGFDKLPSPAELAAGLVNYANDTGSTANAYVVALPKVTAYTDGLSVKLNTGRTNTGAGTLNINGIGAIAIRRQDGTDLQAGDISPNAPLVLTYVQATNRFMMPNLATSEVKQAAASATSAAASAGAAAGSASDAATQATLAQNWATKTSSEVLPGQGRGAQYYAQQAAAILANAALNSDFAASRAASGYQKLPGGLILQWGTFGGSTSGDTAIVFPIAFPNAFLSGYISGLNTGTGAWGGYNTPTKTGMNGNWWSATSTRQSGTCTYFVIGY